jgi:DNA-binding CsgD family transcriptional regulator/tetratricopeptide (TPR) repeat protein
MGGPSDVTSPARRPLRGRKDELRAVVAFLERVRAGVGEVLVVEGDAGLGKTSLVTEAVARASAMSFGAAVGTAEPGLGVVDMAPLMEALFGGDAPLVDASELGPHLATPEDRFWLLQDVQTLLEKAALERPLLICLDDMQWADSGCAFALRLLPQRLSSLPVAWLVALRPDEVPPHIQRTLTEVREAGAETIRLAPLDDLAVAEVATDVVGATPDSDLLRVAARVEGNPFLLVDLLTGLQEEGSLVASVKSGATVVDDRVPHRLGDSVYRRLARMDPPADRVATLASALSREFTVTSLAAMGGFTVAELVTPVHDLLNAGIFAEAGDRLAFRHDLIRDAVRERMTPAVRRALDREAADVLLASGALPVEVATQLAASAGEGDETAIATLLQASEALAVSDPWASADIAQSGLAIAPARHPLRGPLVATRTVSLFAAGRSTEARAFADTALRSSLPAEQEAEVRLGVSRMYTLSPDVRADNARAGLALPGLPEAVRARLSASLVSNLVFAGRTDEAVAVWETVTAEVKASADPAAQYLLEGARLTVQYQQGRIGEALEGLDDMERRRTSSFEDARARLAWSFRSWLLDALDRFADAEREAEDGLDAAQRDRQNWAAHLFETWRGRHFLQTGRLDEASAALEGRIPPTDGSPIVAVLDAASAVALGRVHLHRGDHRAADEIADLAKVILDTAAPGVRRHAAWLLALHAMAVGTPAEAHTWLCTMGNEERLSIFPLLPLEVADEPQLVRIAVAAGDEELARSATSRAELRHELNPGIASLEGFAAHARGLASASIDDLERSVELLDAGPRPLALSSALEDVGRAKLGAGDTSAAVSAFDRALAINVAAGATWDAARVRHRLRDIGVRRRVVALDRPLTGWQSLTEAEIRVARLTAEGQTNREIAHNLFVSPHTVNTHLRHIFDKLGVRSRVDLTRTVEREPVAP